MDNQELNALKQGFSHAFPNPNRIGCPDQRILEAIASKQLPLDDPAYMHVGQCSPCFQEVLACQTESNQKRRFNRLALTMACVLSFTAIAIWWQWHDYHSEVSPVFIHHGVTLQAPNSKEPVPQTALLITLDFRSLARERGSSSALREEIWHIPPRLVTFRVTLPNGSAPGPYQLEIHTRQGQQMLQKVFGISRVVNGNTILSTATINLSVIPPGPYTLLFRHVYTSWHSAPIQIDPSSQ